MRPMDATQMVFRAVRFGQVKWMRTLFVNVSPQACKGIVGDQE